MEFDICVSVVSNIVASLKNKKQNAEERINELYMKKREPYELGRITSTSFSVWSDDRLAMTVKYDYEDAYPYIATITDHHYFGAIDQCVDFIISKLISPFDNKRRKMEKDNEFVELENDLHYILESIKHLSGVNNALTTITNLMK